MIRLMLLAALATPLAWTLAEEKAASDTSKLVGTWTVTAAEKDGKRETASDIKGKQVKITRDTITCMSGTAKTEMSCSYTLDTSATPWKISMNCTEGEHKDKTLKGIVRLEGDTLRICHAKPDKDVPTGFDTKAEQCCMTLERSK